MDSGQPSEYRYLNLENSWLGFESHGLELHQDGALQLAAVPRLEGVLPAGLGGLPAPSAPAGLVFDDRGGMYYTQPDSGQLVGKPDCADAGAALPCLSGSGTLPSQLHQPRGLAFYPARRTLVVADSADHSLKFIRLPDGELAEIWGESGVPGTPPFQLEFPSAVDVDPRGYIYAVGSGSKPLQKFDPRGFPVESFWQIASAEVAWSQPVAVAISASPLRVFVLDAGRGVVVVLDKYGYCLDEFGSGELNAPLGLAVDGSSIYVGSNQLRQVLRFGRGSGYPLYGTAAGYEGPVAALALDGQGGLWVHPGSGEPLQMLLDQAFARSGVLWGGPFGTDERPTHWHTLKVWAENLGAGSHLQLFIATGEDSDAPPLDPLPLDPEPFAAIEWQAFPPDITDVYIPFVEVPQKVTYDPVQHRLMPFLWVGFRFSGDGTRTPSLQQARLTFNHQTYRQHLPSIFSAEPNQADLLDRLLSLFESFNLESEDQIADLRHHFDPQTAPTSWLRWLAGWLALDLDGRWSESHQRQAIAYAMSLYRMRGTPFGLRAAISYYAGVEARLAEPIQQADWWSLADDSPASLDQPQAACLGFTTRLAPVQDDGAVLGGSAQLDASHIETGDRFGASLFENVAHQFTVQVFSGQVANSSRRAQLEQIIEREKPAHTLFHLCTIEPRMRVGFQSSIGLNTVVSGPGHDKACLDGTALTESGLELGEQAAGQIGKTSQVGQDTRLAQATPA